METLTASERAAACLLRMGQAPHTVLHNHDCTVNDDAEVQCPQAHEVGADLVVHHACEREKHGQRDDHCCDQRGAKVAQEQEEDHHHQGGALDQVFLDRGDSFVDQVGAVVNSDSFDTFGQVAVDLPHAYIDRLGYLSAVLANQHEHCTKHDLAAIVSRSTGTQFTS